MAKIRLDVLLVEKGLFPSREKARTAIMSRRVQIGGAVYDKAGAQVDQTAEVVITGKDLPYVSRGGYKLEKAIKAFDLVLNGLVMADIGASTGGFTDCALQNGVAKVYAVDVGYGQLAWSLRSDSRVIVLEKTNARFLSTTEIPEPLDLVTIDASFISLAKLLPALFDLMKVDAQLVALIKPQFEAGKEKVGKKGVVRDSAVHQEVIQNVIEAALDLHYQVYGLSYSPITGPEGNIEYLLWLGKNPEKANLALDEKYIKALTLEAAGNLGTAKNQAAVKTVD